MLVAVLGPLAALATYAWSLRGDAYSRAVAADLESRLRCEADVRGARPTGPASATADGVDLTWTTASGQVAFRLKNVSATRGPAGAWRVTAGHGRLEVQTQNLRETLESWNQRLVQPTGADTAVAVKVEGFTVALASDLVAAEERGTFEFDVGLPTPLWARFHGESAASQRPGNFRLAVHLDPRSPAGVFQMLSAHLEGVPAERLARVLVGPSAASPMAGTARIDMQWARAGWQPPGPSADELRHIKVSAKGLDLAEWTRSLPGGPIQAAGTLDLDYTEGDRGDGQLAVGLVGGRGSVSPETLRWLQNLPAGLKAADVAGGDRVAFDGLAVRCRVAGGRGRFEAGNLGGPTLITGRAFGIPVPLLTAAPRPFDAGALWTALLEALTAEAPVAGK